MLGWFILIGIIIGFIVGTYYLLNYWGNPLSIINDLREEEINHPKIIPKINKNIYEYAYQNNTCFKENYQNSELCPKKVHKVYAFYHIPIPELKKEKIIKNTDNSGKEGFEEEKEIYENLKNIEFNNQQEDREKKAEVQVEKQVEDLSELQAREEIQDVKEIQEIKNKQEGGWQMTDFSLELIKTPVVIGENVIQRMEVSDLPLDMTAIKIRDINATITNLITEVIADKVIIQGIIHKQIFFVGLDNIIHHQSENINFSYFVDIPGVEPGMDVLIEPTVEHIVSQLILDGNVLHQKVVVQLFVKVLSVQQLIIETGAGPLVKVERVIGENSVQKMVNNQVILAVTAIKIVDVTAEVVDLTTDVIADKIIIQGVIHKQLFYIGIDEVEHHQAEDIPFSEFIDVPGAEPGMNVQVDPKIEHIKQELSPDGTTVSQEIVLELFAKVTETVQVNLVTGTDSLVMLPEVIGENTKQILKETTIELDQISIKIKEINASVIDLHGVVIDNKVIVQGVIHKQIFYIGEDDIEYHQQENVPFSTFVDVPGARSGMNVDIIPLIAHIKPELNPDGDFLTQKVIVDLFVKVTENIQFNVNEVGPYGV